MLYSYNYLSKTFTEEIKNLLSITTTTATITTTTIIIIIIISHVIIIDLMPHDDVTHLKGSVVVLLESRSNPKWRPVTVLVVGETVKVRSI